MNTVGFLRNMAGLKLVFCEFTYKGWRVGWAGGGGMSPVEGLGLVFKNSFVEGGIQITHLNYNNNLLLIYYLLNLCGIDEK